MARMVKKKQNVPTIWCSTSLDKIKILNNIKLIKNTNSKPMNLCFFDCLKKSIIRLIIIPPMLILYKN